MKMQHLLRACGAILASSVLLAGNAHAAEAAQPSMLASLAPLVIIMLIFYFLLIRPQQKRLKDHKKLVGELKKGDKVVTGGGLIGTVADVKDDVLRVEIADGVRVKVKRDTITGLAS
jgi:preprotein translocase subunit YajC